MTTIATIAADSWSVSIGGGWIVLMLIGMGFCFAFMGSMWLMRGGRGWAMCSGWWRQQTPRQDVLDGASVQQRPEPPVQTETESSR